MLAYIVLSLPVSFTFWRDPSFHYYPFKSSDLNTMYSIINMVLDELLHRSSISVHAVDHSSSSGMLLFPKSTYQPSNMRRKRTHGFFARWLFLALTFGFIIGGFTLLISMYVNVINISQQSSYFTNRCFIVNTREIDHSNNCIHYCRIYKYYPYQCK